MVGWAIADVGVRVWALLPVAGCQGIYPGGERYKRGSQKDDGKLYCVADDDDLDNIVYDAVQPKKAKQNGIKQLAGNNRGVIAYQQVFVIKQAFEHAIQFIINHLYNKVDRK